MLRQLFYILIMLSITSNAAFSWSLFGPKSYSQCIKDGLEDVDTDRELLVLQGACRSEFPNKVSKDNNKLKDDLKKCGLNGNPLDFFLPQSHPETKNILKKLTAFEFKSYKSATFIGFQNGNNFDIDKVLIGQTNGKCEDSERVHEFMTGGSLIKAGTYGQVIQTGSWPSGYKHFCVLSVQPPGIDILYTSFADLYGFLKTKGYCEK